MPGSTSKRSPKRGFVHLPKRVRGSAWAKMTDSHDFVVRQSRPAMRQQVCLGIPGLVTNIPDEVID